MQSSARRHARQTASRAAESQAAPVHDEPPAGRRWSQHVTETSDALDLEKGVFTLCAIRRRSRHRSSAPPSDSKRRKANPYRSALVDADVLHQPRRQESCPTARKGARPRERRAARAVRQGLRLYDPLRLTSRPCSALGFTRPRNRLGQARTGGAQPAVMSAAEVAHFLGANSRRCFTATAASRSRVCGRRLPRAPRLQRQVPAARAARFPGRP